MPLFWKHYKSDFHQFLDQFKAEHPSTEEEQRAGRAILWDKPVDREAQQRHRESRIPQQAYVYQNKPK